MVQISANKVRRGLQDIQLKIFTKQVLLDIGTEKKKYLTESTYFEMRSTSTAKVEATIEAIISIPDLEVQAMSECLAATSVNIQSFVLDRFLYAHEYLRELGTEMLPVQESSDGFLRQMLIDLWHSRNRNGLWR